MTWRSDRRSYVVTVPILDPPDGVSRMNVMSSEGMLGT